jgi:hypothetical protein
MDDPSRSRLHRKYGEHFEREDPDAPNEPQEPESPYEAMPYKAPDQRGLSVLETEQAELAELRGEADNHYD